MDDHAIDESPEDHAARNRRYRVVTGRELDEMTDWWAGMDEKPDVSESSE
jgi:hypothetical protein